MFHTPVRRILRLPIFRSNTIKIRHLVVTKTKNRWVLTSLRGSLSTNHPIPTRHRLHPETRITPTTPELPRVATDPVSSGVKRTKERPSTRATFSTRPWLKWSRAKIGNSSLLWIHQQLGTSWHTIRRRLVLTLRRRRVWTLLTLVSCWLHLLDSPKPLDLIRPLQPQLESERCSENQWESIEVTFRSKDLRIS